MNQLILVFVGGGLGSVLRFWTYRLARLWLPPDFPWGTFIVNVIGAFAAGLVVGWLASRSSGGTDSTALFLMTGVLGGFTTFSAFSVDAVSIFQRGDTMTGGIYVIGSLLLSLTAALAGLALARAV